MRNILFSFLALILLSGCKSVIPDVDKNYVPDITLKELAEKMVIAVDPNGVYRNSTSYYMRQEVKLGGKTVTYEVLFKFPGKFRTVMSLDNKILLKITSNGNACYSVNDKGEKTEIKGVEFDRMKLLDEMSSTKGTILDVFEKVEFAGEEKVMDSQCYILICHPKFKNLEPIVLYVSKTDYLLRRLITLKDGTPYIASIRKYALIKGVMVATETERDINGDGTTDLMILTDYKLNIDMPDKSFE